jgi:23S rRNA (guanosine2251-2'-O)-methyltransferase
MGVKKVYLCGYTPYPTHQSDTRLPHISNKLTAQINKTALGAEKSCNWEHIEDVKAVISICKESGYVVYGLEQTPESEALVGIRTTQPIALIIGREVEGIETDVLALCDKTVEIPMFGKKESFNVVNAAAMAMYHFRFIAPKVESQK